MKEKYDAALAEAAKEHAMLRARIIELESETRSVYGLPRGAV